MKSSVIPKTGLWGRWFRANLLGFALSNFLLGIVDLAVDFFGAHGNPLGFVAHIIAVILGGAIVGFLQIRSLRTPFEKANWWIPISAVVYPLSFIAGEALGGLPFGLLASFTLFGILSGILQSSFLRRNTARASWWVLISTLGFGAGGLVGSTVILAAFTFGGTAILDTMPLLPAFTIIGGISGGVAGAITGFGLVRLLR
ncbi:MAG: hypothetical protein WEC37_01215 [Anaerolineales bacterium]